MIGHRVRVEIGIACLRTASLLARVPGLFRLAVVFVFVAVIVLPDEYRKIAATKIQWERAQHAQRQREAQIDVAGTGENRGGRVA